MQAFSIWPLHIYRYGIFYLIGFLFGYLGFRYIAKKQFFAKNYPWIQNVLDKDLENLLIAIFLGVLIGGRLGHVIIYNLNYYLHHPAEIIAFWKWGMSFLGWLFGVVVAILTFRKIKKGKRADLRILFDIILVLLPFGLGLVRLGNYLNQELYGVLVSDWLPRLGYPLFALLQSSNLFHVYPAVDSFLRVNTNFLSMFWEGLVTLVLWLFVFRYQIRRHLRRPWLWSALFLLRYSFVRFVLDYFRADAQLEFVGPFTISQRFFVIFFVLAIIGLRNILRSKAK